MRTKKIVNKFGTFLSTYYRFILLLSRLRRLEVPSINSLEEQIL